MAASRADRVVRLLLAGLVVAAAFLINFRFVLVHFSLGGDLLDAGWYAWILGRGDPWLTNPSSVSDLSYFNYHLTPWLSLVAVALHPLGLDGYSVLALHQGFGFALFAAALLALVLTSWKTARVALLFVALALFLLLGDVMLQVASFPHPEIAIPAFCALALALWQSGHRRWATAAIVLSWLVREDGGLYAAAFLLGLATLRPVGRTWLTAPETRLAALSVVVSLAMFWLKSHYFPGFSAFAFNYSGNGWDHLTWPTILPRLQAFARNPHALTTLLPALLLALVAWRYLVFVVLMAPIIVAQLLAARIQLWDFHAYYVTPFLVIWAGMALVATDRARRGQLRWVEPGILCAAAILGSGPFLYAVRPPSWFPVATTALVTPIADLQALAANARTATSGIDGLCVSMGVAALIPNDFRPEQVVDPWADLSHCRTMVIFEADGHYDAFTWHLAYWQRGATRFGHFVRYDQRP